MTPYGEASGGTSAMAVRERNESNASNTLRLHINAPSDLAIYHRVNGTHKHMTMKTMNATRINECVG